jgi:hypothetical protein
VGDVIEFPRRPIPPDDAPIRYDPDADGPVPMIECEPPTIHVFASGAPGAVCQCGSERWADIPNHEHIAWTTP